MRRNALFWTAAVLGVPILFGTFVHGAYRLSLESGVLPFAGAREVYWYVGLAISLLCGLVFVHNAARDFGRIAVCIGYAIVMGLALIGLHLWIACLNGDCF